MYLQTPPFYKLPKLVHIPIAMSMHLPNWWTHYNTEHSIIPTAIAISTLPNVTSIVCGMISKPCSFLNHANAIHIGIHEATELAQIKSSPSFKLTANSICLNNSSVHQRATGMASLRYNMVSLKTGGHIILQSVLHSRKENVQSEHLTRTRQHMLDKSVHQYATGRCPKYLSRCSYFRPWSCLSHCARYSSGV